MKKSLFWLSFGVLVMLLMLAAMVSAPAEEEPPAPPRPLPVCGMQPMNRTEPQDDAALKKRSFVRAESVPDAVRQAAPECPSADANGVPLLRLTYRRANFRAFHYPDEAG